MRKTEPSKPAKRLEALADGAFAFLMTLLVLELAIPVLSEHHTNSTQHETREQKISKRINAFGWALFFIMIGCLWLVPLVLLPESTWLIGAGLIMLGTNYFRHVNDIKPITFNIIIGILAIVTGIGSILGIEVPVFPVLIIFIGLSIIFGHLTEKNHPRE